MTSPIGEIPTCDLFLLVGCDLTEEYPVLWLRMKQAVDRGAAIVAITPKALEIERFVAHHLVHRYHEGSAVLGALAQAAGGSGGRKTGEVGGVDEELIAHAGEALRAAKRPMVMIGKMALEAADGETMYAEVEDLCGKLGVRPSVMRGKGNAFGAALVGLLPNTSPGGRPLAQVRGDLESVWGAPVAVEPGLSGPQIIEAAARGELDVLFVAGADPSTDVPDRSRWASARSRLPFVVVVDAFLTETAQAADVVLPALVIPEKDGTVSNIEGRVQRVHAAVSGPGQARGDWQIMSGLAARLGTTIAYSAWEEIFDEMKSLIPGLEIDAIVPPAAPARASSAPRAPRSEARRAAADGEYPLVLIAGDVLFDRGSMSGRSPAIADLAHEPWAMLHPDDAAKVAVSDGDPIVLTARRGSIAVTARVSKAVPPGHMYVPRGYDAAPVNAIMDASEAVTRVRVRALVAVAGAQGDV
jgi:predicted molibdopterin-dependent oxidoreductase YjgC